FKWENNAKYKAGVTVVVIGLRNKSNRPKFLFKDDLQNNVANINPYLTDAPDVIIEKRRRPIGGDFPPMVRGSQPTDGGQLSFSPAELELFSNSPQAVKDCIKKYAGASEYINGIDRFCLWIEDEALETVKEDPEVA